MKIVADCHIAGVIPAFAGLADVTVYEPGAITPVVLQDCDALLVRTVTRVDAALLENTSIRFVGTATSGCDHVDQDYLFRHGIGFASAAGSNARPVAEYVLSALAVLCEQRNRRFRDVSVGIIGCGHVGSLLADLLQALGIPVLLNDPPLAEDGDPRGFCDLETVLTADIVTLHVPLTTGGDYPTCHLLNERHLARLNAGTVLINTARGGVVDESALCRAIRDRGLQAVLDVWQDEPAIDMELATLALLGTPHIAGYSLDAKHRATQYIRAALVNYFELGDSAAEAGPAPLQPYRLSLPAADFDEQARLAILAAYDVRGDAAQLQRLQQLPAADRPAWFTSLRQDYILRQEFGALELELPAADSAAATRFRQLGFRVADQ